jgi:hypothetical protein
VKRRILVLLAICALALSTISQQAHAYNLNGGKWPWTIVFYCITTQYSDHDARWASAAGGWNSATSDIALYGNCGSSDLGLLDVDYSGVAWDGTSDANPSLSSTHSEGWGYLNYYYTAGYGPQARQSVAGHELGHLYGLDHSSGAKIMEGATSLRYYTYGVSTPQADDINGVEAIY